MNELDQMILEVVSDDLEPFELVISKLSRRYIDFQQFHTDQIRRSLLCNTVNGFVGAYLIHAEPPYVTAVSVSADTIDRYWFHITESGRKYLREVVGEHWSFANESREAV